MGFLLPDSGIYEYESVSTVLRKPLVISIINIEVTED